MLDALHRESQNGAFNSQCGATNNAFILAKESSSSGCHSKKQDVPCPSVPGKKTTHLLTIFPVQLGLHPRAVVNGQVFLWCNILHLIRVWSSRRHFLHDIADLINLDEDYPKYYVKRDPCR